MARTEESELRNKTKAVVNEIQKSYNKHFMVLGRNFFIIKEKQHFYEWGFNTFRDYIDEELGFSESTANKMVNCYNAFDKKVDRPLLKRIGFSKVSLIAQAKFLTEKKALTLLKEAEDTPRHELVSILKELSKKATPLEERKASMSFSVPEVKKKNVEKALAQVSKDYDIDINHRGELLDELCKFYLRYARKSPSTIRKAG